eukprot:6174578-Pleurochrysis_carterae.AAC.3
MRVRGVGARALEREARLVPRVLLLSMLLEHPDRIEGGVADADLRGRTGVAGGGDVGCGGERRTLGRAGVADDDAEEPAVVAAVKLGESARRTEEKSERAGDSWKRARGHVGPREATQSQGMEGVHRGRATNEQARISAKDHKRACNSKESRWRASTKKGA